MNMHHITKSLFVGAAIAGIGMSSGRAEIKIPESLKNEIRHVVERRLEECYQQVQNVIRDDDYRDWWETYRKDDTNLVCSLITDERWGFFYFCSLEMMNEPYSFSTLKRDLRYFFEEQCPPYGQRVQFSNKRVERSALLLNRIIRSVIGEGNPFGLFRDHGKSHILAQKGIVDEGKYGFYFKHSFVFSDEFIERIAGIIHNSMTIVNKMYEITQGASFDNEILKVYLSEVERLYMQYLVIKNSPKGKDTIAACNRFIEKAGWLMQYDCRISPFCDELHIPGFLTVASREKEKINAIRRRAVSELRKWEFDVRDIREGNFADPVYWAPAPVSDEEGAEILKELEENDTKKEKEKEKEKDTPNAFLEEID